MKEEILLLKIQNALKERKDYYEATRGNWKINKSRLPFIQYVAGISGGKVVCAFQPSKWEVIEYGTEKGRKRFEGNEVPSEILVKLQKKEEQVLRKFGRGSAVAYISLTEIENY
ncbi:hypothetical protein WAX74_12645 [Psychrobacillus sp. FJAT-51614]|uniref:Uncharacterized protein n=1 Tax=Psychrobacillus mangrovi TaxID=3117745 RepID=A0ABU8F897_9BACI